MADEKPTDADQDDGRPDWPDGVTSARKALELGLPGWPKPGDELPPPPGEVPPGRGGAQRIPRPYTSQLGGPAPWADLDATLRRPSVADVRRALDAAGPPVTAAHEVGAGPFRLASDPLPDGATARVGRPAAVVAPVYEQGGHAVVVLTRRTWGLSTHEGEVSFPGGRVEPGETTGEAALREAKEEVGLDSWVDRKSVV